MNDANNTNSYGVDGYTVQCVEYFSKTTRVLKAKNNSTKIICAIKLILGDVDKDIIEKEVKYCFNVDFYTSGD